jgi:hypothetical protein
MAITSPTFGSSSMPPREKNIHAYRRHLFAQIKQWAYDHRIQIDTSVYFEQETIKAIFELHFNPGEGVAHLALASKGLSILA